MVNVSGTIVRVGGVARAIAVRDALGTKVTLDEGWCWVSPGDQATAAIRVQLPTGLATVEPGATALCVVEGDRSSFIFVADGTVVFQQGERVGSLARGTIAMIDPAGYSQVDAATDDEIAADPMVALNLSLDAEL